MTENIFILAGGNIGDRLFYLKKAGESLVQAGVAITNCSAVYETAAWAWPIRRLISIRCGR